MHSIIVWVEMSKRETYHIELKVRENIYDYILEQARTQPLSLSDVLNIARDVCNDLERQRFERNVLIKK